MCVLYITFLTESAVGAGSASCTSDNTRRVLHVHGPDSIASTIMNENRNVPTLFFYYCTRPERIQEDSCYVGPLYKQEHVFGALLWYYNINIVHIAIILCRGSARGRFKIIQF